MSFFERHWWKIGGLILLVLGFLWLLNSGWTIGSVTFGWPPGIELNPQLQLTNMPTNVQETLVSPSPSITNPPVFTPWVINNTDWYQVGTGKLEIIGDSIRIQSEEQTTAYIKNEYLHNFLLETKFQILSSNNNSNYGIVLRRQDHCQFYYLKLIPGGNNKLRIELIKFLCNNNLLILSENEVFLDLSSPHVLKVEINGGSSVNILAQIDQIDLIRIQDERDFIWAGDVGLSVENADIKFTETDINGK